MARNRTFAEIKAEVYERSDVDTNYVSAAEMGRMVNASLAELYDLLVSVNKDLYVSSQSVSVVSGTDEYDLASDFYRIEGVDVTSGSKSYPMKRFNFSERNALQDAGATELSTRYRAIGTTIKFIPTPNWSGTVTVWYCPAPSELDEDSDTWNGFAGWEEYAVVDCCIKLAQKQEEDATLLVKQKADLVARIRNMATDLDDNEPDRIRDVEMETLGLDVWDVLRNA